MATRIVTIWQSADIEGHLDALAGIETGAADLGEVPVRSQIAGPHFGIRFEAAAGQDHRLRGNILGLSLVADTDAADASIIVQQFQGRCLVEHLYAVAFRLGKQRLQKFRSTAPNMQGESAPEFELTVNLIGLAT